MKRVMSIMLILNILFFTSCWDMRELNQMALVMAVGIDRVPETNLFRVTAQMARPTSGNRGNGGAEGSEPVYTASAEGRTIFEAIRNLAKFTARKVMWAHNNIIVIGEPLAREDITPVVDFFTHNQELRMKTFVAVSRGEARGYIAAKTGIENIPGLSLSGIFMHSELPGESVKTSMLKLFSDFLSKTKEPIISGLRFKERVISVSGSQEHGGGRQVELAGAAIFKGNKMVGWLSPEESRGVGILRGEIKDTVMVVSLDGEDKIKLSVEMKNIDAKYKLDISEENTKIKVDIKGTGMISEQDAPIDNMDIYELKKVVGELTGKEIEKQIRLSMDKVQKEYKSDVVGFGKMVHIQNKKYWHDTAQGNWEELYPKVELSINTDIDIETSYLFQEPIKVNKESE